MPVWANCRQHPRQYLRMQKAPLHLVSNPNPNLHKKTVKLIEINRLCEPAGSFVPLTSDKFNARRKTRC